MTVKKTLLLAFYVPGLFAVTGCHAVEPGFGQEAVLISHPIFFGSGGVDPTPVKPGLQYVALSTDAVMVNMLPFKHDANFDDMNSRDGVPLDFHAQANFKVTNSVALVSGFGVGEQWYENNLAKPFESYTRRAVNKHTEAAITAPQDTGISALDAIDDEVTMNLNSEIKKLGLPVILTDLTLGKANPPASILDQRTKTATERQRAETEKQGKLAEDQRKEREKARAEADNAYRTAMQLNPDQFLQLESIKAMRDVCGAGKCSIVTTGALPTFGITR